MQLLCGATEVTTDPPDANPNLKTTSPLITFGRDEQYIDNLLHLLGASSVILHGVGDGMVAYCCLMKRIPCLLIYGKRPGGELHQKLIHKFLVDKVQKKIEAAAPGSRWYRTNSQLGCRAEEEPKAKGRKKEAIPAPMKEEASQGKKDATPAQKKEDQGKKKKRSSSDSSSGGSSSAKSKKSKK